MLHRNDKHVIISKGWFNDFGVYTMFDGQYGSTGKGLLASWIAEHFGNRIDVVTTSAGPNSGHTSFLPTGERIIRKQLPTASVVMDFMGLPHVCFLNAGAVIDMEILRDEVQQFINHQKGEKTTKFTIHSNAALIHDGDFHRNQDIASTGRGVGPALIRKLERDPKDKSIFGKLFFSREERAVFHEYDCLPADLLRAKRVFMEIAQGWSLGLNQMFYPYVTARECSVAQGLSDLGVSPLDHVKSIVSLRTFPIRVGNTDEGWSGNFYADQSEMDWAEFEGQGIKPERTTVTNRVRRIFTWSKRQFCEMLRTNKPDALFLNFMNYLGKSEQERFVQEMISTYKLELNRDPDFVLLGFGSKNSDVRLWKGQIDEQD